MGHEIHETLYHLKSVLRDWRLVQSSPKDNTSQICCATTIELETIGCLILVVITSCKIKIANKSLNMAAIVVRHVKRTSFGGIDCTHCDTWLVGLRRIEPASCIDIHRYSIHIREELIHRSTESFHPFSEISRIRQGVDKLKKPFKRIIRLR